MLSLRDKLRAAHNAPKRPATASQRPQDCFVRESRYPLDDKTSLPCGILPLMQGDDSLPNEIAPESILFLDTETTGLSTGVGTVAFLIGVGFIRGKELIVRQYLMRDYDEEIFVLQHIRDHLLACHLLITFNGKSFDMPLLESRFTLQRIRIDIPTIAHADLLHTARRVWKLRLRRCTLAALEEHIYHEPRTDDLPGAMVPQRYFDYLKTHDFSLLEDILEHNAQDVATLARLLYTLSAVHLQPLTAEHVHDIFSLGRVYEKRGKSDVARTCYRAADAGSMSEMSREYLANSYRKAREPQQAALIYEKMITANQGGARPYIALSKLLEHKLCNIPRAADIARKGMLYLSNQPESGFDSTLFDDLSHRYARLLKKLQNMNNC